MSALCQIIAQTQCDTAHTPQRHTYSRSKLVKPSNTPAGMLVMALFQRYLPTQHILCVRQSHTLLVRIYDTPQTHQRHTYSRSNVVKPSNTPAGMLVMALLSSHLPTQHIPCVRQSHTHCDTAHTPQRQTYSSSKLVKPSNTPAGMLVMAFS